MAAKAAEHLNEPIDRLEFSFFTAGTGNAGPTIVSATFLLLCQRALTFKDGVEAPIEPWTSPRRVDFGPTVGSKPCWLLDNPDVPICHLDLGIPNISSRFGTAPLFWNYLFAAMKLLPRNLLADQRKMEALGGQRNSEARRE